MAHTTRPHRSIVSFLSRGHRRALPTQTLSERNLGPIHEDANATAEEEDHQTHMRGSIVVSVRLVEANYFWQSGESTLNISSATKHFFDLKNIEFFFFEQYEIT